MKRTAYIIVAITAVGLSAYFYWAHSLVATTPGIGVENGLFKIWNCEEPRNENAVRVCPTLHCWKAIYESRQIKAKYTAKAVEDHYFGDNKPFILTGKIQYKSQAASDVLTRYRCVMKGDEVLDLDLLTESMWKQLNDSGQLWEI